MEKHIDKILIESIKLGASDVHISSEIPIGIRVHGELIQKKDGITIANVGTVLEEILTEKQLNKLREELELDMSYEIKGISRFRINVFYDRGRVGLSIRIIPTKIPTMEEINMDKILTPLLNKQQGLILITGPTGSGKSTTLASFINHINNTEKKRIVTLEDPIEYMYENNLSFISQREIGKDTTSFPKGLRASLRQDPDIILIGELRDLETMSTAVTAAETGHLVLGTLHTTDASSTIDRIIDMFPSSQKSHIRSHLSSVLISVISQRLIRRSDRKGRHVATEVLINNTAVANLIRNDKTHQINNTIQTSSSLGMHTIESSLMKLVQKGIALEEEVAQYINNK